MLERLSIARTLTVEGSTKFLESRWSVDELFGGLAMFERTDDGTDAMAFRLSGGPRGLYVYLYGGHPDIIRFDLEDRDAPDSAWDNAVARGAVDTPASLRAIANAWLRDGRLPGPVTRAG